MLGTWSLSGSLCVFYFPQKMIAYAQSHYGEQVIYSGWLIFTLKHPVTQQTQLQKQREKMRENISDLFIFIQVGSTKIVY